MVHSVLAKVREELLVQKKPPERIFINIPNYLIFFRTQRPMMIQTDGQYEFCYLAIHDGIQKMLGSGSKASLSRTMSHYQKFPSFRLET